VATFPERGDAAAAAQAFPQPPRPRGVASILRPQNLPSAAPPVAPPTNPVEEIEPARQQAQAATLPPGDARKASTDPVCRSMVDEEWAAAAGLKFEYRGKTYFFVSKECRDSFAAQPGLYLGEAEPAAARPAEPAPAAKPRAEAAAVKDPVCGMQVDVKTAVAAGLTSVYKGTTYYFCSEDCKKKFDKEPAKYAGKSS
jgi:YHS domain-containing protein